MNVKISNAFSKELKIMTPQLKIYLLRLEKEIEDTLIDDVRNLFRLKKGIDDTTLEDKKNLFRLKKKMNQSKTE